MGGKTFAERCGNRISAYRWELAVAAAVLAVLCFFVAGKEGYHMDELLSFELANAEYNPWIVPTQPEGRLAKFMREEIEGESPGETLSNVLAVLRDTLENRGNGILANFKADVYEEPVWIDRQRFHDYITAEDGDAFNYLSVYFNVKDDNHPPLHFMLLHTVSSVFRGKISPWMGCAVNLAAVAGCLVLLMALGRKLCGNRWHGIAAALLYGLSAGAAATTLLIRMYGVMTLFCVWALYLHLEKWRDGDYGRHNKLLITVTVLGFLTQYFFLFYAAGLALVTAAVLAARSRWKELLCYIRSMGIAAVIGLGVFPFAVSDVFASERGVEALGNLAKGFSGYGERLAAFGKILAQCLPGGFMGALALLLLAVWAAVRTAGRGGKRQDGGTGRVEACFLLAPFLLYFLLAAKMSPYLVDRYIMPLFPLAALIMVRLAAFVKLPPALAAAAAGALCLAGLFSYGGEYQFKGYAEQERIARTYGELPCVCVYEGYGFYKNLTEFAAYEKTLLVTLEELENRGDDPVLGGTDRVVVLVKNEIDREGLSALLLEKYGYAVERELLSDGVHHDAVWLCGRQDRE